jgi:hypothetical protein
MKFRMLFVNLFLGCIVFCIWTGCVSTYRSIDPDFLSIDDYWKSIPEANVEIAMDDDVLTGPRNKQYAKMQKKNKVSLVVLTIHNAGQRELRLPHDFVFQSGYGDSIQPLSLEAAMESLVKPVTDEENSSVVEVDMGNTWDFLWGAGKAANETKIVVSHIRFASDMLEHYMVDRTLSPDAYAKGFLVLPVQKGTPVEISIRPERGR